MKRISRSYFRIWPKVHFGYEIEQLSTQRNYADYALIDRGLKLAIVEIKSFQQFAGDIECAQLQSALVQAARYADRHRTSHLMAFDGEWRFSRL